MVGVFLLVQLWRDMRFLGAYVTGIVALLLGLATVNFYVDVAPLPPALQSAWLVIHVFVATLGTGFFAVGGGLSIAQLLQARRESGQAGRCGSCARFPSSTALENLAYRVIVVGFAFWTFTLIAGAIWAERAWGRYWGWDTKEVWTFIIWVALRRLHPRPRDPRMARHPVGLARDHRLRGGALQLHDRQPVLQGPARLLRALRLAPSPESSA